MHFDLSIITGNLPLFLAGAGMTLVICLIAFVVGMVLGSLAALLSLQGFPPLRWLAGLYILVMRGIPFIALLFLIHFGLPTIGLRPPPLLDGTASLSLYAGAYYAEIIRACVKALPPGQWESARTIGLSRLAAARHIILPQILAPMIAPVVNCTITMIKESAVVSSITVSELTFAGLVVQGNTFSPFEVFVAVALLYWLITALFSVPARYAEAHLGRHGGQRMTRLVSRYLVLTGARAMTRELALRATGLVRRFGTTRALDDVYLDIPRGQVVSLVGPSGCGKSTLLRALLWIEPPDEGFIEVGGQYLGRVLVGDGILRRQSPRAIDRLRARIGMVHQQLNLWPHLSARENVALPQRSVLGRSRAEAEARAETLLGRLQIGHLADRRPGALSGGQRQRVAIARALAMDPEIMLFDEPTSALDPELVGEVLALLREFAAAGMTMLVVTHEIAFARDVAQRLLFMDRGRIIADGPPAQIITSRAEPRVAEFFDRVSAFHPQFRPPAGTQGDLT